MFNSGVHPLVVAQEGFVPHPAVIVAAAFLLVDNKDIILVHQTITSVLEHPAEMVPTIYPAALYSQM